MSLTVANTILQQLGGNRFLAMTGAKNLLGSENGLSMKVGSNDRKVTHVRVNLTPADTYRVEFMNIRGVQPWKTLHVAEDVYAEDLQRIFTEYTGLDTRL